MKNIAKVSNKLTSSISSENQINTNYFKGLNTSVEFEEILINNKNIFINEKQPKTKYKNEDNNKK